MAETTIRVVVDPSAAPPPTATDTNLAPPTTSATGHDTQINARTLAFGAFALNTTRNIGTTFLGQVGALTGSGQKQRDINEALRIGGFAARLGGGALTGTLPLAGIDIGIEIATEVIQDNIRIRNTNLDATYRSTLRGSRFLGNR